MKPLVARSPARLGPARALELAWSGMRFRLFRSSVTVAILALAVAFLAHTISHGLLGATVRGAATQELERSRALGQYLTRLSTPDSPATVRGVLAAGAPARLAEYRAWGALTESELAAARDAAARLAALIAALERMPPAARAVVLADQSADEVVVGLGAPEAGSRLAVRLERAGVRLAEAEPAALAELAGALPVLERTVERVVAGHARATEALAAAYAPEALRAVVARAPEGFAAQMRREGFALPDEEVGPLAAFAGRREDLQRVGRRLLEPEVRSVVARELGVSVGEVGLEMVVERVRGPRRLAWLAGALAGADTGGGLGGERLGEIFAAHRREQRLTSTVGGSGGARPDEGALPVRTLVLVGLSFLVCVVGVMNAMLMSVTERFTEIATMKCLGGLDGFIMGLFVFEAVIQGVVGGAIGGVLGLLLAILRGLVEHGALLGAAAGAAGPVLLGVAGAMATGVVLAALAAVGPAWLAARLAPMEAMRVD